eukprot:1658613-Rhodomonas_salina.1
MRWCVCQKAGLNDCFDVDVAISLLLEEDSDACLHCFPSRTQANPPSLISLRQAMLPTQLRTLCSSRRAGWLYIGYHARHFEDGHSPDPPDSPLNISLVLIVERLTILPALPQHIIAPRHHLSHQVTAQIRGEWQRPRSLDP